MDFGNALDVDSKIMSDGRCLVVAFFLTSLATLKPLYPEIESFVVQGAAGIKFFQFNRLKETIHTLFLSRNSLHLHWPISD